MARWTAGSPPPLTQAEVRRYVEAGIQMLEARDQLQLVVLVGIADRLAELVQQTVCLVGQAEALLKKGGGS